MHLLITHKLTGPAETWFHSKPAHISMSWRTLIGELQRTFGNHAQLCNLQEGFLNLKWRWHQNEKFFDYYQEKVKLGSSFNIPEHLMVKHLIEGLDNPDWEKQAKSWNIQKTSVFLESMEKAIMEYNNGASNLHKPREAKEHFKKNPSRPHVPPSTIKTRSPSVPNLSRNSDQQNNDKKKGPRKQCPICKKYGHSPETCFFKQSNGKPKNEVLDLKSQLADGFKDLSDLLATANISSKGPDKKDSGKSGTKNQKPKTEGVNSNNKKKDDDPNVAKRAFCSNCRRPNHTADVCQLPTVPYGVCFNCGSADHKQNNCPYKSSNTNVVTEKGQSGPKAHGKKNHLLFNVE